MTKTQTIFDLPDKFFQLLAIVGIGKALSLNIGDACKRTSVNNDLYILRVDIYTYLSAWLVSSIESNSLMPIEMIEMRHKEKNGIPDKTTYQKVIQAIEEIIGEGLYTDIKSYPDSDPFSDPMLKDTTLLYLSELILLMGKCYPLPTT
jgi:hypothetical protein